MKKSQLNQDVGYIVEEAKKAIANQVAINIKILASAAQEATKLIASANETAVKLIASNAAESAKALATRGSEDHDLLVGLKMEFTIEMKGLKSDIKDIKEGTTAKIESHTMQLDVLEKWRATLVDVPTRLTTLENTNLAFSTQVKTWIVAAGILYTVIAFLISKFL